MSNSRNCAGQQSSVNRLDQCNTSVDQDASHSCLAYDALPNAAVDMMCSHCLVFGCQTCTVLFNQLLPFKFEC